jgi:hypothetical protein
VPEPELEVPPELLPVLPGVDADGEDVSELELRSDVAAGFVVSVAEAGFFA